MSYFPFLSVSGLAVRETGTLLLTEGEVEPRSRSGGGESGYPEPRRLQWDPGTSDPGAARLVISEI